MHIYSCLILTNAVCKEQASHALEGRRIKLWRPRPPNQKYSARTAGEAKWRLMRVRVKYDGDCSFSLYNQAARNRGTLLSPLAHARFLYVHARGRAYPLLFVIVYL